jgi:hypothetical protein
MFNFDTTALESTSQRNVRLNTFIRTDHLVVVYPYVDTCFDIDTTHMTADVKKEGISLRTSGIEVSFRIPDIKNERKLVY